VQWLVKTQNPDGSWGRVVPDQKRSQEVLSLLVWQNHDLCREDVWYAMRKNMNFLLDDRAARQFGVLRSFPVTGFTGLAVAELMQPGITYRI
jgi:hypothetical protein